MKKNSNLKNISLTSYDDIFKTDEERNEGVKKTVSEMPISALRPFANHPFKLYEGERFAEMLESVKENGIIIPIIVRSIDDEKYEILSGHNRVEAAKAANFETVQVIIREDLTDNEALLIVTETNLRQRSFTDLTHSERAAALAVRHEAIKNQERRTDLITDIESILKIGETIGATAENPTSSHVGTRRATAMDTVGEEYSLSKNSVARYLRMHSLIEPLKKLVDDNSIPFLAGVSLSYISPQNQADLFDILQENENFKIDMKKAELLREFSVDNQLARKSISDILAGVAVKKRNRASLPVQSIKIKGKILSKYFKPEQKPEEIEAAIIEALELYTAQKNNKER